MNIPIKTKYIALLLGSLFAILTISALLLISEYRYFKQQAEKLVEIKDEYRNYLIAVKKIVDEYNKSKDQDESSLSEDDSEKKKGHEDLNDAFLVVNREPNYLKQSMIDFIKQQGNENVLTHINFDEWRDYNEQLLDKTSRAIKTRKKTHSSKAIKSARPKRIALPRRYVKPDIHFAWPIDNSKFWLSSLFGPRKKPNGKWGFHHGLDMAALKGTPVKAAYDGTVVEAANGKGFGKTILISHNSKYKTRYAHLSKILVSVGQKVKQGDIIGKVGDTGVVRSKHGRDPSHLHFEVLQLGKRMNPMYFLM